MDGIFKKQENQDLQCFLYFISLKSICVNICMQRHSNLGAFWYVWKKASSFGVGSGTVCMSAIDCMGEESAKGFQNSSTENRVIWG